MSVCLHCQREIGTCLQCHRDPDDYNHVRRLTEELVAAAFEITRYRNLLDELHCEITAAKECLPRIGGPLFDAHVTGSPSDFLAEAEHALANVGEALDAAERVLKKEGP